MKTKQKQDKEIFIAWFLIGFLALSFALFIILESSRPDLTRVCRIYTVKEIFMCDQNAKCRVKDNKDHTVYISFPIVGETREVCTYEYEDDN